MCIVVCVLTSDSRAMMQLGEIAMESASKSKINAQLAQEWYRRSASGDPPQADALFQLARMYHEVHMIFFPIGHDTACTIHR